MTTTHMTDEQIKSDTKPVAKLYRMVMENHICPYGLKSKYLLEHKGYEVEDHHLTTREETDAFKEKYGVETTPQTFIREKRIGGYDGVRAFFDKKKEGEKESAYRPIIVIFLMAFLMSVGVSWALPNGPFVISVIEKFIAIAMCLLAVQKLRDLTSFTNQFLGYDLLAQRYVPYAYVYPFAEALAGILMLAGVLVWVSAPIAFFIGTVGAISVYKAVYIDKRELKCACVGGDSDVPLGFVSLTENILMVAMAIWMVGKTAVLAIL